MAFTSLATVMRATEKTMKVAKKDMESRKEKEAQHK
jgi:hypothetical protein